MSITLSYTRASSNLLKTLKFRNDRLFSIIRKKVFVESLSERYRLMATDTPVPSLPQSAVIIEPIRWHATVLEFDCGFSDGTSESRKYLDHIDYDYDYYYYYYYYD